jgi:glycosyltransferase involved in cell wall biosynthesis
MSDVRATVAICTRNRAPIFARALEKLSALDVPDGTRWELVIVDNDSTDHTQQVIASFRDRLPIRDFIAKTLGISAGRNRAVAEARGDYILWIDDDALVSPAWLATFLAAFDAFPEASLFGGPIAVAFDAPVPAWFDRILPQIAGIYAYRDLGPEPIVLAATEQMLPFGTNYVTRANDQRRFEYNPLLGRHPDHPARGSEETDLMLTMLESGLIGRWVPGALVTHMKSTDRANLTFIAEHSASYGAYRAVRFGTPGARIAGAPWSAWRRLVRNAWRYAKHRTLYPPERWIDHFIQFAEARGAIRGLRAESRGATTTA